MTTPREPVRLQVYRDDGSIAQNLGQLAHGQLPPLFPALLAGVVTLVMLAFGAGGEGDPALFAPVVALLLTGPASSHPHDGRLDWLVPPLIRAIEYGYLAVLGFTNGVPEPLIYALIAVLAYHHYDTVYRTRQRLWPPEWLSRAGFGWEGRMLIAAVACFVGVLPFAYAGLTAYLGVMFGIESVQTWTRTELGAGVMVDLEEGD
ncbi:MAG: hypothetical protein JWN00_1346 [Actinomycetia bacterium]|jgi:hypothetical protein|nr:hypothetical protein [Actinomycetes bacterium]